jgi:hypothetical protein
MSTHVVRPCQVRSSNLGAKGFYYINENSSFFSVERDIPVQTLNFVSSREFSEWQAVSIENRLVNGSILNDGHGVFWILRKNLA